MRFLCESVELGGVCVELAYWHARVWGLSDRDIKCGIAAGVVLAALPALCSLSVPTPHSTASQPVSLAAFAFISPFHRFTVWIHRERWFYVARVLILFATLIYVGFSLISTAPIVFGQGSRTAEEIRELADQSARLRSMEEWRRDLDAQKMPGRLMVIEKTVTEMADEQKSLTRLVWGTLAGICIWLLQQLFMLLMKRQQ